MFLATHAVVGLAIAQRVESPLAALGLAFLSHFVLDFIPHGDQDLYRDWEWKHQKRFRRVAVINLIDLGILTLLLLWLYAQHSLPQTALLSAGVIGSILPDLITLFFPVIHKRLTWLFLIRWLDSFSHRTRLTYFLKQHNRWHDIFHRLVNYRISLITAIGVQVIIIIISLATFGFGRLAN